MDDLKQEYLLLFNGITDAITNMETLIFKLRALQQEAENRYIERTLDTGKTRYYPSSASKPEKDAVNE